MDVLHQQVSHARFGVGTVTDQKARLITVAFDAPHGTKTFLYPDAFQTFLTLTDEASQARMQQEIQALRDAADALRRQQEAEQEATQMAERIAAMAQKKKAAATKRAATRKLNQSK